MEVGQGLPEETGQALAPADTIVLPESWTVTPARTGLELPPSDSDTESKIDRERSDCINVYSLVSQDTRNVERDCSNRMTQELQELIVNAGLNSGVNAQENAYEPVSSSVKNVNPLDATDRNSSEDSGTRGSSSFDNSVHDSQSLAQFPKSSEVGGQVAVSHSAEVGRQSRDEEVGRQSRDEEVGRQSRDEEVGRQSRDEEVGRQSRDEEVGRQSRDEEDALTYSDWCQPCRQKTGPCEDGHVSCEVRWSTCMLIQQVF
jgi:hypothetical protein